MENKLNESSNNRYIIKKENYSYSLVFNFTVIILVILCLTIYLIDLLQKWVFNFFFSLFLIFLLLSLLSLISYFFYKNRNIEIYIDKSQQKIKFCRSSPNHKILRKIDFSRIRSIIYYRSKARRQPVDIGGYLAIVLKNYLRFKITCDIPSICREYGIAISSIIKKPLFFKINFKPYILLTLLALYLLILSLTLDKIYMIFFPIGILFINLLLIIDFKEKKKEDKYLNNYVRCLK